MNNEKGLTNCQSFFCSDMQVWFDGGDGRGGFGKSHAKGAVGLEFSKSEWSTGTILTIRRINHSVEPLSKPE